MKQLEIGQLILQKLKEEERSQAWLAKKMGRHRGYVMHLLEKNDIYVNDLTEISKILNYNFLELYASRVNEELSAK
ncbi:MAG: XRE family transcriptional regulator [Bacteroidales bacterium]|nr:XRE family transcriptional regulator [Bacteroidales bacterium]